MSRTLRRRGTNYGKIYPESKGQFRRIWWDEEPKITHTKTYRYQEFRIHKLDEYTRQELDKLLKVNKDPLKSWYHSGVGRWRPINQKPSKVVLKSYNKYDLGVPMVCHVEWQAPLYATGLSGFVKVYHYDITSLLYVVNVYEGYEMKRREPRTFRKNPYREKYCRGKKSKQNLDLEPDSLDKWDEYNEKAYPILVDCGLIKEDDGFEEEPYDYFASLDYFHDLMDFAGDDEELKFKLRLKWLMVTQERWSQERNF